MKNSMHLDKERSPFPKTHSAKSPAMGTSKACHPKPGGASNMSSANAVMKRGK